MNGRINPFQKQDNSVQRIFPSNPQFKVYTLFPRTTAPTRPVSHCHSNLWPHPFPDPAPLETPLDSTPVNSPSGSAPSHYFPLLFRTFPWPASSRPTPPKRPPGPTSSWLAPFTSGSGLALSSPGSGAAPAPEAQSRWLGQP